jgi:membrane-associated phospholipid phosphatase
LLEFRYEFCDTGINFTSLKPTSLVKERPFNNFGIAFFFSIAIALATGIFILLTGKFESFQIINRNNSSYTDVFFKYFTYAGDGWMWALLGLFCVFFRKKYLIAVVAGIIISTLLSQFMKRVIYPDELRPITYLVENFPVHVVDGVSMRSLHSFPSGHSAAAFTIFLIIAHMVNKKTWSFILPLVALLVGYSRVYLGQHFLTDVFAGMIIGIFSACVAVLIQKRLRAAKSKR